MFIYGRNVVRRVIWIVLDSVGMGEMPDAMRFGDAGCNTLAHTWEYNNGLEIPNLINLGLGNIDGMRAVSECDCPLGAYARIAEQSNGKDTTVGHWEMAGIISSSPFPTYPEGFPKEIIDEFVAQANIPGVLCNGVASGTEVIERFGDEHVSSQKPIVYTSADSVFQIAVDMAVYSLDELYHMCEIARKILTGEHEVARVIARPYIRDNKRYVRTSDRRDYAIVPPDGNLLTELKKRGQNVIGVGKIEDIFAKAGITSATHTKNNMDGVDVTLKYMADTEGGLIFTNLVEFDSTWGHRRDAKGYGTGLEQFDARLPEIMAAMRDEDILIINSDHGCDPTFKGTDHTREYIPLLVYSHLIKSTNLGTREGLSDIGQTVMEYLTGERIHNGVSFLSEIMR